MAATSTTVVGAVCQELESALPRSAPAARHRCGRSGGTIDSESLGANAPTAAVATIRSSRSAFVATGRSSAHTFAGFPTGHLLDVVFGIVPEIRSRAVTTPLPEFTYGRGQCFTKTT